MESSTINCDRENVSRLACKTGRIHNTGGIGKKTLEAHIGLCKGLARSSGRSLNTREAWCSNLTIMKFAC
jgi:hypothetical protein